jgi:tRNA dimethylallyltransferase
MPPLLVIVGPTASGKSKLALDMAERHNGEIICADSRTVYTGMDIGTAKPSLKDQARVKHHLLDITTPNKYFNASDFQQLANQAIDDITDRGKLPILVGGSGLYVDGVIFDFKFLPPVAQAERERLNKMSIEELQAEITEKGYEMPENSKNPRYLMRTLERAGAEPERGEVRQNTLIIGLQPDIKVLKGRITKRVSEMINAGLVDETKDLATKYGWDAPGLLSTSYKVLKSYIKGDATLEESKAQFIQNDMHFAKRQKAWFKRNPHIQWFEDNNSALAFAENWLIENKSTGKKTIGKIAP